MPATADDLSISTYINALRQYGRDVAARYDALVTWATTPAGK